MLAAIKNAIKRLPILKDLPRFSSWAMILDSPVFPAISLLILMGCAQQTLRTSSSIHWKTLPDAIGYINLRSFDKPTFNTLEEALRDLEAHNIRALILDLRNNPGGLLEQAVAVADKFLEGGTLVVYTKGSPASQNMRGFSRGERVPPSYPMVILVNGHSVGASEIVAGALQDLDRATIIGTKTAGAGAIRTMPRNNDPGSPQIIAKAYTPKGRAIEEGIIPDITVDDAVSGDPQLQKAVAFLREKMQ